MPFYLSGNRLRSNKIKYTNINGNILPNHINSSTTNRLINKSPSTDMLVYSSQNPYGGPGDAGIWVRNPSCWINGVTNISCFSPAQLSGANWFQRAGTLITKKHFICARHFITNILSPDGTGIIFVDDNNNAIKRNLIAHEFDPRTASNGQVRYTDIAIGLLDNEVPDNIKIAKVLPTNYGNYLEPNNLLAVALDQQEKAILKKWSGFSLNSYFDLKFYDTNLIYYNEFSENMVVGDSGNPAFLIIDNELVLLSCFFSTVGGPFVTDRYDAINEAINRLSPSQGYSLTPINLELVYHKYS